MLYFGTRCCTVFGNVDQDHLKLSARRLLPQPKRGNRWKRFGQLLVVLSAVVVMVDAIVGDRGLLAMRRARHQYDALSAAVAQQRDENARLREEVRRLKDDPRAIEELARRELGLIRPGEKVFIVKDLKSPTAP